MEDLTKNKSTLMLIFYLVALYIEYPLYLMVVMSGLSKMDFYHVFLFSLLFDIPSLYLFYFVLFWLLSALLVIFSKYLFLLLLLF